MFFYPFGGVLSEILLSFDVCFVLHCAVLQNFFWGAGQSCKKIGNTVKWGYPIQNCQTKSGGAGNVAVFFLFAAWRDRCIQT